MVHAAEIDFASTDTAADAVLRTGLADPQRDSLTLMQTATALIEAEEGEALEAALDLNLKLWVAIRTIVNGPVCALPNEVRDNLRTLAKFTIDTTMEAGIGGFDARKAISLARIDMSIAEGLLSAEQNRLIAERAYEIWEKEGRPEGQGVSHWLRAEQEMALAVSHLVD
jgi:flagellar biosynthesis regulator FlaF